MNFDDGDIPRSTSMVFIYFSANSICYSHVDDFNTRNKVLTAKLLRL